MPQLMPLNWSVSVFMVFYVILMGVMIYYNKNNMMYGFNPNYMGEGMVWLW